jgi:hypothetical protein
LNVLPVVAPRRDQDAEHELGGYEARHYQLAQIMPDRPQVKGTSGHAEPDVFVRVTGEAAVYDRHEAS